MKKQMARTQRHLPRQEQPPAGRRTAPAGKRPDPTVVAGSRLAAAPAA
jgi:hypothetical protein